MLTVISLWDKEADLRKAQREVQEKEAMLKEQTQQMAQDQEKIAALEAELALKKVSLR
jgi:multidrug resistance efflux pump